MNKICAYNDKEEEVNILHFQGGSINDFNKTFNFIKNNALLNPIPSNLSIISCWTDDSKCNLLYQCNINNIKLINAVPQDYDKLQPWNMLNKIIFYINALKNVNTEYCVLLDGYDVLFCSTDNLIEKFKHKGYKIIFNTSFHNYPPEEIDIIYNRDLYGLFKYFNAGCCIGYRNELIKFYEECLEFINIKNKLNSEQKVLRHAFAKYSCNNNQNFIFFDFRKNIFHTMGNTIVNLIPDEYKLYIYPNTEKLNS